MSEAGASELDLQGFLRLLRRRLWVVLLVPALTTAVALTSAAMTTPQYRSSVEILFARTQAEAIFNPFAASGADPHLLANQIKVLRGEDVAELARERLGFPAKIRAKASSTEDVITLTAVHADPRRAATAANVYARAYLDYRRSSAAEENATAQAELRNQISAAEARLVAPGSPSEQSSVSALVAASGPSWRSWRRRPTSTAAAPRSWRRPRSRGRRSSPTRCAAGFSASPRG